MSARKPGAGLALLGLLASVTAVLLSKELGRLWAGPHSTSGRTAQLVPSSPEPPLAEPPAGQPAGPPAPPPAAPPAPAARPPIGTPCPEDPPVPVVAIRLRVPACADAGQELEYHICVENLSQAPAHHVLVRNPLPANARFVRATPEPAARDPELLWELGTLEACACRRIVLVLMPTGTGDVKDCARVQFEHGECVCTKICRPAISLRKCGPTQAFVGETLTYQLAVTNTGSAEVIGVTLTDTLPPGLEHASGRSQLTWDVGNLAPGQCRNVEYQVTPRAAGRLCNRAVATAAGSLREETEHCVTVAEARMTLAKTGPTRRYVNLPTTYQITVTNTGTAPLGNVVITDPVPAQMAFVRATAGGRLATPPGPPQPLPPPRLGEAGGGGVVQWSVGPLEPGASRTVEAVLRARAAGRICNRATAVADRGLTAQAEACTDFLGVAALLLEVVDTEDPVEVGAETSYIILVRNQGSVPATNVRIAATAPEHEAVIRATGPSDNRKEGQRILFDPLTLAPGREARYEVYVKTLKAGDVRFKVDLTADQLTGGPVHEEESTTIYAEIPSTRLQPAEGARPYAGPPAILGPGAAGGPQRPP